MTTINVIDAGFSYPGHKVFENLNLTVDAGEIFCLIGPNGCGKTTLLDCMLGINQLSAGRILLDADPISAMKPQQIARRISYVPQMHEKTFPYTVLEIVLMGRAAYTGMFSSPSKDDRRIAEEALESVGFKEFRNRPYTSLSGGEGQLVMIARALAQKTGIIIMDEPTSHLDFKHEMTILETIVKLVKENGLSVVMATHFPNHAFYFENNLIRTNVALMSDCRFIEVGEPSSVLNETNIKELYDIDARIFSLDTGANVIKQIVPISKSRSKHQ